MSRGQHNGQTEHDDKARRRERSDRAYHVLRHRDYRLLWSAEFVSQLGSKIQQTAIVWQVYELTHDSFQLGLLGLCRFVPIFLFGLIGGVVADRGDRRRTLLVAQLALLMTSALLAWLTFTGSITLAMIYGLTVVSAIFGMLATPTRQALIPALIPRHELPGAMTMAILAFEVAAVSGPAVGGQIISRAGLTIAYGLDALSFGVVVLALIAMRSRPIIGSSTRGGFSAAIEGIHFLRRSPVLLGVMGLDFLATFFSMSTILMPIFADEILRAGPDGLGLLLAAPAAGAVIGSAVMSTVRAAARPGRGVLLAVAVYGGCMLGFGLSQSLGLSLALLAGSGTADAVSMALRHTVRNLVTPDSLRGRVAAVHTMFAAGGPHLGDFEAGVLATVVGAGPAVAIGGLGTLLTVAVVALRVPAIAGYGLPVAAEQSGRDVS